MLFGIQRRGIEVVHLMGNKLQPRWLCELECHAPRSELIKINEQVDPETSAIEPFLSQHLRNFHLDAVAATLFNQQNKFKPS